MEQRFKKSGCGIDLRTLREFCQREGKTIDYRKGEQFEREGDPARCSICRSTPSLRFSTSRRRCSPASAKPH